ncbi:putative gustatory receptor 2a [Schistocerca gregaria]|uniref:putative gustatory receptor 2a n=1 Tax=Schistocerca gregaria TaxID=7010 RepID=UPI00211DCEED|nr:putative gustatory receptor 2a [Schistocerca gregaria]
MSILLLASVTISLVSVLASCIVDLTGGWGVNITYFVVPYSHLWQVQFFGIVLTVRDRLGVVCTLMVRSVRPPLDGEAQLEEAATSGGRRWVSEGDLRRLQRARLALHRVARLCGGHFGIALLLSVVNSSIRMVLLTYGVVLMATRVQFLKSVLIVAGCVACTKLVVAAGDLLAVCWACSSAEDRAATVGRLADRILALPLPSPAPRALHLSVERLTFSAAGFFDIDLHLFVAVVGTVVTYIVILAQYFV